MIRLHEYHAYRLSGLWHVHTNYTDGANTPEEIVDFAVENHFPLVGFVEHVREDLTYDFEEFRARAFAAAADRPIECVVGCEAKVLDVDGTLDVSADVLEHADVVYAAYHGTPFSQAEYVESVLATLENPAVDVWAHPFTYPTAAGFTIPESDVDRILETLVETNVHFERNLSRPPTALSRPLRSVSVPTIVGYDLHDLDTWSPVASQ